MVVFLLGYWVNTTLRRPPKTDTHSYHRKNQLMSQFEKYASYLIINSYEYQHHCWFQPFAYTQITEPSILMFVVHIQSNNKNLRPTLPTMTDRFLFYRIKVYRTLKEDIHPVVRMPTVYKRQKSRSSEDSVRFQHKK